MRKILGIAAVILFFLILVGLLLFKLLSPGSSSDTSDQYKGYTAPIAPNNDPFQEIVATTGAIQTDAPEHAVATCYSMYVHFSASQYTWDVTKNASVPEIQKCFSSSFISSWIADIQNGNGDYDGGGISADPVLLAQTYSPSWLTSMQTHLATQSSSKSDVYLTLGSGNETHQLLVSLAYSNATGWQINDVQDAVVTQ